MLDITKLPLKKQLELVRNHNTPSEVLQQLDLSKPKIQKLLASNPNTAIAILEKLSGDPNQYVRLAAKKNIKNRFSN